MQRSTKAACSLTQAVRFASSQAAPSPAPFHTPEPSPLKKPWCVESPTHEGRQKGVLSRVWARSTELTVTHGKGCMVYTEDGKEYLDFAAGIAVVNTGHCHPRVVDAIQRQATEILHAQINNYHTPLLYKFTERVGGVLPEGRNHVYYDNSGTAGIEAAVKMVRQYQRKPYIVCLHGGMHGRSGLCSAMTSCQSIRNPVSYPLPSGFLVAPFPYAYKWGLSDEEASKRALEGLEDILLGQVRPTEVAAVILEPILGEGGFVVAPQAYMDGLKAICEKYGILIIADEVQAGYGRSGKMWSCEHWEGVLPDVIVSSKGLASGMPLSMVATTEGIMDSFTPGTHGGTFNGNAVAMAAALATLDVFEEEGLVANSAKQGATLKSLLLDIVKQSMPRADVRGRGLMVALECATDDGKPSKEAALYIKKHCEVHSNVILLSPTGFHHNILRLMPPLVIQETELMWAISAIESALRAWKAGKPINQAASA